MTKPSSPRLRAETVTRRDLDETTSGPARVGAALAASGAKAAIDFSMIHDMQHAVGDDDEIAFLPPMSGG